MPFYDMKCAEHGHYADVFCKMANRHSQQCPECGEVLTITPRPVAVHGYTIAKPLEIPQIGERFESNSQMRDYFRANPDAKILSEAERRDQKHRLQNRVEATAVKQGFNSRQHRSEVAKANASRGRDVFGNEIKSKKVKPTT